MEVCKLDFDNERYAAYPSEEAIEMAKNLLKPSGAHSNGFNKQGLKKVERIFVPSKDTKLTETNNHMRQTDYRPPLDVGQHKDYYHIKTQRSAVSLYDRLNSVTEGYDQKLHRDDRHHAKLIGLRTHDEECRRVVPMTTNALYGHPHRPKIERNTKEHSHRELCKEDFNSRNGINFAE